jgi:hypothetical protein
MLLVARTLTIIHVNKKTKEPGSDILLALRVGGLLERGRLARITDGDQDGRDPS